MLSRGCCDVIDCSVALLSGRAVDGEEQEAASDGGRCDEIGGEYVPKASLSFLLLPTDARVR